MDIISKPGNKLTLKEKDEINSILREINPCLAPDHLEKNHINKHNPLFYILKVDGEVTAFQSFLHFYMKTPFKSRKIPIIYIGLSYRKRISRAKGFAKNIAADYLRKILGPFFYFKSFIFITFTVNPKLFDRLNLFFPSFYPNLSQPQNDDILIFLHDFYYTCLNYDIKIESNLTSNIFSFDERRNITSDWNQLYKARRTIVDQYFIEHGIIEKEGEEYFLTGNQVHLIGYYNFLGFIKKRIRNSN